MANSEDDESTSSSFSTTSFSARYYDPIDSDMKYVNPNFTPDSDSSGGQGNHSQQTAEGKTSSEELYVLPGILSFHKEEVLSDESDTSVVNVPKFIEKSLAEMGYEEFDAPNWEKIAQPRKESLYTLLLKMVHKNDKPNVQIDVGGTIFPCHLIVLQCYSKFFMDCNHEVLVKLPVQKITPEAFKSIYEWMLSDEPLVKRKGILDVFKAATFLRIQELLDQCWVCFDDDTKFREDTAFMLYLEARDGEIDILQQLMLTRVCKFFLCLASSTEFLGLCSHEVCVLLNSNTIGVNSEIEIFYASVRWLSRGWAERESELINIMKCVRFGLMPPWLLVMLTNRSDCIEVDRIVKHPAVKKMINDGIFYHTILLYYAGKNDEFQHLLKRYQLVAPHQRQWIYDEKCPYHHSTATTNHIEYVTYRSFLEYLKEVQAIGQPHWRTLRVVKEDEVESS